MFYCKGWELMKKDLESKLRILLVDDENDILDLYSNILVPETLEITPDV